MELKEPSAARAAKHLPALTVFVPRDSPVQERSVVNRGGHRGGSHLVYLQSSRQCLGSSGERDAPKDCFLLRDLHLLPTPSLRLTPTAFFTTSEVLVFLTGARFLVFCIFIFFFLSMLFFSPWILSLSKEMAGAFMLQLLLAPLVLSRWRESALVPVFLPLCTCSLVG